MGWRILNISYSRVALYRKCPHAHYLRYVAHVKKRAKSRPLYFGSDFHKLLENRNSKKKCMQAMDEIREAYNSLDTRDISDLGENYLEDLFTIFKDYRKVYKGAEKPIATELEFSIPMFTDKETGEVHNFIGIIDELYDGYKTIGEHKTFTKKPDNLNMTMNTQAMLYAKAVEELFGVTPRYIQWDYIKSEVASFPVHLKGGKLSTAKSQQITPYSWKRACKEYGCEDQLNMADMWQCNISNYFFRLNVIISPNMVEEIWKDFVKTSKEIIKRGHKNKVRHVTKDCCYCDYKDICKAEFTGGNAKYILEKDFIVEHKDEPLGSNKGLSDQEMINWLQRFLLVHSILYYDMNANVIDDNYWDKKAKELCKMMDKNIDLAKKSEYWKYYYDFDGSTGFDLVERLKEDNKEHFDYLRTIAGHVLSNSNNIKV